MKEFLEKLLDIIKNQDAVKIAITLDMAIQIAEFIDEAFEDFTGEELTPEQQLALYDKYDELFLAQKSRMKENIRKAKEKAQS